MQKQTFQCIGNIGTKVWEGEQHSHLCIIQEKHRVQENADQPRASHTHTITVNLPDQFTSSQSDMQIEPTQAFIQVIKY